MTLARVIWFINGRVGIEPSSASPMLSLRKQLLEPLHLKFNKLHSFKQANSSNYRSHGNRNLGNQAVLKLGSHLFIIGGTGYQRIQTRTASTPVLGLFEAENESGNLHSGES